MTKTSAELEREVEEARGRIDRTVEALKDKMQPHEMLDEATRMMGGASNKVLTTAVEQLRENPVPIALIGLGVAWLAVRQTQGGGQRRAPGYYETYEGYDEGERLADKLKAGVETAKDRLSGAADRAREGLSQVKASAAHGADDARGKVAEFAAGARARAGEYGHAARRRFDETLDSEPLVIGAIGLAVGAAIGASLPSTRVERRYIGPARSKAADKAKASLNEVRDVAQRAYGQVKDELHRQTGPAGQGSTLRDKAEAVAGAGAQAVRDQFQGGAAH